MFELAKLNLELSSVYKIEHLFCIYFHVKYIK
jgi:hypothetical protein